MTKVILVAILTIISTLLLSCNEHDDFDVTRFDGEYRYYKGIAEFFDCKQRVKYYVAKAGIDNDLQQAYLKLNLKEKDDDVFIQLKGYLKEEKPKVEGINPMTVFVAVELLKLDTTRGCVRGIRQGD